MHRVALAAAALAMIAAGCTSSSGVTAPTHPPSSVPAVTTTVAQTSPASTTPITSASATIGTTTSAAPASIAVPTVAVTASAPGTDSPPTTLSPTGAVTAAVYATAAFYNQCSMTPKSCDTTGIYASDGKAGINMASYVASLRQQQFHLSTDLRGTYIVVTSVTFDSPTVAEAVFCGYDAGTLLGPNGPDGSPTIVDDTITSARRKYTMHLEDGAWKLASDDLVNKLGDGNQCPPAK